MSYPMNDRFAEEIKKTDLTPRKISKLMHHKYPSNLYNVLNHQNQVTTKMLEEFAEVFPAADMNYIIKGSRSETTTTTNMVAEAGIEYQRKRDKEITRLQQLLSEKEQTITQLRDHLSDLQDYIKTLKESQKK